MPSPQLILQARVLLRHGEALRRLHAWIVLGAGEERLRVLNCIAMVRGDVPSLFDHVLAFVEVSVAHMPILRLPALPIAVDISEVVHRLACRKPGQGSEAAPNRWIAFSLSLSNRRLVKLLHIAVIGQQFGALVAAVRLPDDLVTRHCRVHFSERSLIRRSVSQFWITAWLCDEEARVGHVSCKGGRNARVRVIGVWTKLWLGVL